MRSVLSMAEKTLQHMCEGLTFQSLKYMAISEWTEVLALYSERTLAISVKVPR